MTCPLFAPNERSANHEQVPWRRLGIALAGGIVSTALWFGLGPGSDADDAMRRGFRSRDLPAIAFVVGISATVSGIAAASRPERRGTASKRHDAVRRPTASAGGPPEDPLWAVIEAQPVAGQRLHRGA